MASSKSGDRLKSASGDLFKTLGDKAVSSLGGRMGDLTDRLEDVASGNSTLKTALGSGKAAAEGDSPVKGALKGAASAVKDKVPGLGGGSGGSGSKSPKATKATNIIEQVDVGVPVRVAYDQWTEFGGFPSFMKKVEKVDAKDDEKLEWKAQIVWSHRTWEATILEQVPDERIVWRSKGEKGHVDGTVTFHEVGPSLTRIIVVLEYYPQGLFERTGNIWRAQARRAKAELKHFQRHVMTRTILDPDEIEGWRGTIEDGEVVQSHEEALEEEESESEEQGEDYEDESEDESESEPEDEPEDE
ncbi:MULTISPECIES: SRPBCC family protein, partial [unclassified Nocardioides]|uniref:SRPBCC family protein n=1 Tax=unclassified Nocardioides TaxID=2615069 RepID=UPI00361B0A57